MINPSPQSIEGSNPEQQRRLNFESQPFPSDFVNIDVFHAYEENGEILDRFRCHASGAQALAGMQYGIGQGGLRFGNAFEPEDDRIPHLLIGPVNVSADSLSLGAVSWFCKTIKDTVPHARISLASYYNLATGTHESYDPQQFDTDHDCNTLFPDEIDGEYAGPSLDKILNAIVCETVRFKFKAEQNTNAIVDTHLKWAREEATEDISNVSALYDRFHLWHRGPTDGAIMLTTKRGQLISQARTDKTELQPHDFSLLLGHAPAIRTIQYAGYRLPSSDTPELIELNRLFEADKLEQPKIVAHFHHPTLTRGGEFPANTTDEEIEYGMFESGQKIFGELQRRKTNWLILKNHGLLWLGDSPKEFKDFLKDTLGLS